MGNFKANDTKQLGECLFLREKENSGTSKDTATKLVNILDFHSSVLYKPRNFSDLIVLFFRFATSTFERGKLFLLLNVVLLLLCLLFLDGFNLIQHIVHIPHKGDGPLL